MINSKSYFILVVFMVLSKLVFAQYHDANWVISTGYGSINHNTLINFPPGGQTPQASLTNGYIPFAHTNANISDQNGNLIFITNGINIYNRLFQPISGKIPSNFVQISGKDGPIEGLFYATSIYILTSNFPNIPNLKLKFLIKQKYFNFKFNIL